jgi:pimeloyl-ACP methyl ester carboxylesterase
LLWTADHPEEIAGLMYLEAPVMLSEIVTKVMSYTPEGMGKFALWWWVLPLAPGAPEILIVGHERAFLSYFYERAAVMKGAFNAATVNEYLRTFSGREGVLGALGPYRAAFTTIDQTTPLKRNKVKAPIFALGAEKAQGDLRKMVEIVAENVDGGSIPNCGHFIPEECPDKLVSYIKKFVSTVGAG